MFPSPGDLRRPTRLGESTLRSPRVSSLHNVIAERGCSGEGDQTPLRVPVEAHLESRVRSDERVTLIQENDTKMRRERKKRAERDGESQVSARGRTRKIGKGEKTESQDTAFCERDQT